jgi:glycosyltransferase involved in cell wall biosynthesis
MPLGRYDRVWVVVPAHNEAPRIASVLESLRASFRHVVVVDDGSTDDTASIVARCPVWSIRHSINCGQGAAIRTGIRFALGQEADVIATFDADGQHQAGDLKRLIDMIGRYDVALGSRFLGDAPGISSSHYRLLKLAVAFTRWTTRLDVTDTHNGLRAFSRRAARRITITQNRMAHASEILSQIRTLGLSFIEVPVTIDYRVRPAAKGRSWHESRQIIWDIIMGHVIR